MSVSVVLYAEGRGDTGGATAGKLAPGDVLYDDEWLGAAHLLVRRVLCQVRPQLPAQAVRFRQGLNVRDRLPRGSDLVVPKRLSQLLAFAPGARPDIAVVLIDADGHEADRRRDLAETITHSSVPAMLAVSVQEFESWLVADHAAVRSILGVAHDEGPSPEGMAPGAAKTALSDWTSTSTRKDDALQLRRELAQTCDLSAVARRCPAFLQFTQDVSRLVP